MYIRFLFVLAVSLAASGSTAFLNISVAHAQGYGAAGCGLGSLLFGTKSGFSQILAATTNPTFGSQTFGITSGTSNCNDTGGGAESAKAFIEANQAALAKDISRGSGETVNSLAALAGCRDAPTVGATLQQKFRRIYPNSPTSSKHVTDSVLEILRTDEGLQCRKAG